MMKKRMYLVMACCAAFLLSCADLDPLPWTQNDAFISTKYAADSSLVHGLSLYSRSNKRLASSTATTPSGDEISMNVYIANQPYEFLWDDELSSELPEAGTYSFYAITKSDDKEVEGEDVLKDKYLVPTKIVSCEYDSVYSKLNVVWRKVTDASYAVMYIKNAQNKEVYATSTLTANDTTETITASSKLWLAIDAVNLVEGAYVPTEGEELTLQVVHYKKDATDENAKLLDARAICTYNFIWHDSIISE